MLVTKPSDPLVGVERAGSHKRPAPSTTALAALVSLAPCPPAGLSRATGTLPALPQGGRGAPTAPSGGPPRPPCAVARSKRTAPTAGSMDPEQVARFTAAAQEVASFSASLPSLLADLQRKEAEARWVLPPRGCVALRCRAAARPPSCHADVRHPPRSPSAGSKSWRCRRRRMSWS